jgi:hypothetical protein
MDFPLSIQLLFFMRQNTTPTSATITRRTRARTQGLLMPVDVHFVDVQRRILNDVRHELIQVK